MQSRELLTGSERRQVGHKEKIEEQFYGVGFMALVENRMLALSSTFHRVIDPWDDMMFAPAFGARGARVTTKEAQETHCIEFDDA